MNIPYPGDFTRLDLIHQTYDNLNACLTNDMLHTQQLYVGLSARDFVQRFRQKALVLFKLMLLERKVYSVGKYCNCIQGVILKLHRHKVNENYFCIQFFSGTKRQVNLRNYFALSTLL